MELLASSLRWQLRLPCCVYCTRKRIITLTRVHKLDFANTQTRNFAIHSRRRMPLCTERGCVHVRRWRGWLFYVDRVARARLLPRPASGLKVVSRGLVFTWKHGERRFVLVVSAGAWQNQGGCERKEWKRGVWNGSKERRTRTRGDGMEEQALGGCERLRVFNARYSTIGAKVYSLIVLAVHARPLARLRRPANDFIEGTWFWTFSDVPGMRRRAALLKGCVSFNLESN